MKLFKIFATIAVYAIIAITFVTPFSRVEASAYTCGGKCVNCQPKPANGYYRCSSSDKGAVKGCCYDAACNGKCKDTGTKDYGCGNCGYFCQRYTPPPTTVPPTTVPPTTVPPTTVPPTTVPPTTVPPTTVPPTTVPPTTMPPTTVPPTTLPPVTRSPSVTHRPRDTGFSDAILANIGLTLYAIGVISFMSGRYLKVSLKGKR